MTKTKAVLIAIPFCAIFPIRWWEGKPLIAMGFMLIWFWFLSAGYAVNTAFFMGNAILFLYELVTLPKRVEKENKRLERL